jgi:hypothetical protein
VVIQNDLFVFLGSRSKRVEVEKNIRKKKPPPSRKSQTTKKK